MNGAGSWKVTVSTPMGPQVMQLHIATQGEGFSGRIESPMGNLDITGSAKGNALNWIMELTKPLPIKVTCDVVVDGDTMSGTAKMGFMGKAKLIGERIAAGAASAAAPGHQTSPAGPITADSIDPVYSQPYVAVNELRDDPVPHRYVHGGFKGTDARFSFYFPPEDRYHGRFFHNTYPMATHPDIAPFPIAFEVATGDLGFTLASGAYYVQTNLGGADRLADRRTRPSAPIGSMRQRRSTRGCGGRTVRRASALRLSVRRQRRLVPGDGRRREYERGVGRISALCAGHRLNAIPSMFTVRMHALRVLRLRNKFPGSWTRIDPGGSGDPYAELNEEEPPPCEKPRCSGYPLRSWWNHEDAQQRLFLQRRPGCPGCWIPPMSTTSGPSRATWARIPIPRSMKPRVRVRHHRGPGASKALSPGARARQPARAGLSRRRIDDPQQRAAAAEHSRSVRSAGTPDPVRRRPPTPEPGPITPRRPGAHRQLLGAGPADLPAPPGPRRTRFYGWNQFREARRQAHLSATRRAGRPDRRRQHRRLGARPAHPRQDAGARGADGYRRRCPGRPTGTARPSRRPWVRSFDDNFALWFIDHAQHDNPARPRRAHTVSYAGALQQGLRDLAAWVENGVRPAGHPIPGRRLAGQVPAARPNARGIQPVVDPTANGGARAEVAVGEPVTLTRHRGAAERRPRWWPRMGLRGHRRLRRRRGSAPAADVRLSATHALYQARNLLSGPARHLATPGRPEHALWAGPEHRAGAGGRHVSTWKARCSPVAVCIISGPEIRRQLALW